MSSNQVDWHVRRRQDLPLLFALSSKQTASSATERKSASTLAEYAARRTLEAFSVKQLGSVCSTGSDYAARSLKVTLCFGVLGRRREDAITS
ncbi:predicted protein [Coccidioides posadasii str. Silveira]|uniref:Predicted protein n=1 Tax=Coccidioides posadasii (strain RMSCC 757 / Silveira) TaxID=443226 RepID=E9CTY9_COCPS|nr:predicted protein [Coccidioides posadasii str. Silveira]